MKWEFIYKERQANLFPFYVFAKPWGMLIRSILGKNLKPILLIFSEKGIEYFVNQEAFHKLGKMVYILFLKDKFYNNMTRKVDEYGRKITKTAELIEGQKLSKISEKQLIKYFKRINKEMLYIDKWGQLLSLTEYGSNNYTTKGLMKEIEKKVKKKRIDQTSVQISTLLSNPIRSSYFRKESLDFLRIAVKILKNNLSLNSSEIKKEINQHARNFRWINFGYVGPALISEDFRKELKELIIKKNLEDIYQKKKNELSVIKKDQEKVEEELKLNKLIRKRFFIVRDQTYYKEYRKEVLFHGFYACELIQKELAKRWKVPLMAFRYILPHEYKKGEVEKLYNQRKDFCVYYLDKDKEFVLTGDEAKEKISKLERGEKRLKGIKELKGNAAFLGKVKGTVRIVMGEGHLHKVKKGDVLVSFSTNPQMIVAMKKSAAIVTEQGGITSHAAIVSRELHIPCIVGVKNATKAFKDGDLVEVDANNGTIRKLK